MSFEDELHGQPYTIEEAVDINLGTVSILAGSAGAFFIVLFVSLGWPIFLALGVVFGILTNLAARGAMIDAADPLQQMTCDFTYAH